MVHHGVIFLQVLSLKSRRYSWFVVGVGVSFGVSHTKLSSGRYKQRVSDALLSACWEQV
jgi:hypothetical protein